MATVYAQAFPDVGPPARFPVDDDHASWDHLPPGYDPPNVDLPRGNTALAKVDDHPDPDDPRRAGPFRSHEVDEVAVDQAGRPRNPIGPTGLCGRGILNKWGPNRAADAVVTRHNSETGRLEVLLIARGDASTSARKREERALPGGKVDPHETEAETAARELVEETGITGIDVSFADGARFFAGYVDDPRNTDNAWMETVGFHRHLSSGEARSVVLPDGSRAGVSTVDEPEVAKVEWALVTDELADRMYGSHRHLLRLVTERLSHGFGSLPR